MRVWIESRQRRLAVSRSALRKIAAIALAAPEPARAGAHAAADAGADAEAGAGYDDVGVILVDDQAMRCLNRNFRGLDRTTDVLSFDLRAARVPGEPRSGEVVIAAERVLVQARRYRQAPARELARLVVHGLLHLRGFDHRRAGERQRMRAAERAILGRSAGAIAELVTAIAP
jgi:probable rRNA maturation factor